MIEKGIKKDYFLKIIMPLFFVSILVGCTTANKDLYYWGNYSNTLYAYTKEPSPKTLDIHKKELLNIVATSEKQHKRVPPGIYAELGHLTLAQGNQDLAKSYFQKELVLYPESDKVIAAELQKKSK